MSSEKNLCKGISMNAVINLQSLKATALCSESRCFLIFIHKKQSTLDIISHLQIPVIANFVSIRIKYLLMSYVNLIVGSVQNSKENLVMCFPEDKS